MGTKLSYSLKELEAASGLGKTRLYELLSTGALTAVKCGTKTLISADEFRRFLAGLPKAEFHERRPSRSQAEGASEPPPKTKRKTMRQRPPSMTRLAGTNGHDAQIRVVARHTVDSLISGIRVLAHENPEVRRSTKLEGLREHYDLRRYNLCRRQ